MTTPKHIIETERLTLRPWRDSDRAPFAAMGQDPEVMRYLAPLPSRAHSDGAIDKMIALDTSGQPYLRAVSRKSDDAFLGFVGLKQIDFDIPYIRETDPAPRSYEIGWRLARPFWKQGYASEAARASLAHGFDTLPIPRIYSFTVPDNLASQAVMSRIGMHRIAGGDFDHPKLAPNDPLLRHVLYAIDRPD